MTGWLCDRCGATNDSAADFCARCGADGQTAKRIAIQGATLAGADGAAQLVQPQPAGAYTPAARPRPGETIEQAYLRQIRNAAVFIAWIVGIIFAFSLILDIIGVSRI